MAIPLGPTANWHDVAFKNLKPNQVQHLGNSLIIDADDSSSPLFYRLEKVTPIKGITAIGSFSGTLKTPNQEDDYPLRIGLVTPQNEPINWFKKLFAPAWLKALIEIDPSQSIKGVHFFILSHERPRVTSRTHPKSDLIQETFVQELNEGKFSSSITVEPTIETIAIWLQSDADDSHSKFRLTLNDLSLITAD